MIKAALLHKHTAHLVDVVCDVDRHKLPIIRIEGIESHRARETAERVRSAIESIGVDFPRCRVTVKVADADALTCSHTGLDLPIALSILCRMGIIRSAHLAGIVAHGELSLAGNVRSVRSSVPVALAARQAGLSVLVPSDNAHEVRIVDAPSAGVPTLARAVEWLRAERRAWDVGSSADPTPPPATPGSVHGTQLPGLAVQQAVNAAIAGLGMVIYTRPHQGAGETALAFAYHNARQRMEREEALESASRFSASGLGVRYGVRPFRAPHHTVTKRGVYGDRATIGEASLAYGGTLMLDDIGAMRPEVKRTIAARLHDSARLVVVAYVTEADPCPWERLPRSIHERCPIQVILGDVDVPSVALSELRSRVEEHRAASKGERVERVLSVMR